MKILNVQKNHENVSIRELPGAYSTVMYEEALSDWIRRGGGFKQGELKNPYEKRKPATLAYLPVFGDAQKRIFLPMHHKP